MTINEVNGAGQPQNGYTKVKVTDKDSGKSFVIDFKNAKVKGNEAEWTIKDGKVFDKAGKEVKSSSKLHTISNIDASVPLTSTAF